MATRTISLPRNSSARSNGNAETHPQVLGESFPVEEWSSSRKGEKGGGIWSVITDFFGVLTESLSRYRVDERGTGRRHSSYSQPRPPGQASGRVSRTAEDDHVERRGPDACAAGGIGTGRSLEGARRS